MNIEINVCDPQSLHAALATMGEVFGGLIWRPDQREVQLLLDGATPEQQNAAQSIVAAHKPVIFETDKQRLINDDVDIVTITARPTAVVANLTFTLDGEALATIDVNQAGVAVLELTANASMTPGAISIGVSGHPHTPVEIEVIDG